MTNKREDDNVKSLQNNSEIEPNLFTAICHSVRSLLLKQSICILDFCEMTNKREDGSSQRLQNICRFLHYINLSSNLSLRQESNTSTINMHFRFLRNDK